LNNHIREFESDEIRKLGFSIYETGKTLVLKSNITNSLGLYPHGLRREDRSLSIAKAKRLLGLDRPGFWIVGLMRTLRTLDGKGLTDKRLTFYS